MTTVPKIRLRGVCKSFGDKLVLDGVDLDVMPGTSMVVIGGSGSGKSVLLKCILGLIEPDAGSIEIDGQNVLAMDRPAREAARARIGMLFQNGALFDSLPVWENVAFGLLAQRKIARAAAKAKAVEVLGQVGLAGSVGDLWPAELSGGMQKRVALARAIAATPEILFFDEPTTGLDPQARHLIWERLKRLLAQGKTILLTTHFMDEAERLCTRLLVLDHGKKIAEGSPRDLINQHLEPDVVEVYGTGALDLVDGPLQALAARVEVSGETVFFYTQDAKPLLDALSTQPQLRTLHRPVNLEDLFLKLTGRQIREDA